MKYLRKFNEDVTDGSVIDPVDTMVSGDSTLEPIQPDNDDDIQVSVFNDIESDLDNMDSDEAVDYLKSVIAFCSGKLGDMGSRSHVQNL